MSWETEVTLSSVPKVINTKNTYAPYSFKSNIFQKTETFREINGQMGMKAEWLEE